MYTAKDRSGVDATKQAVHERLARREFFWLDILRPGTAEAEAMLDLLRLPPDSRDFLGRWGRRPTLLRTQRHAWLSLFAAASASELVELHAVTAEGFVVSTRQGPCSPIDRLLAESDEDYLPVRHAPQMVAQAVHRLTDAVVGSFNAVLDQIDDEIDDLQVAIVQHPSSEHLQELFAMQRSIIGMRRVVVPQRDVFSRLAGEIVVLPQQDASSTMLFRLTYDQFVRLSDLLDNYRDLVSGALDMHLSTISNRLGEVTTQLTIIATIFLPLSFLTGFFGQNFQYLVHNILPTWTFFAFGLGLEAAAVLFLFVFFKKRGWVGSTHFSRGRRRSAMSAKPAGGVAAMAGDAS